MRPAKIVAIVIGSLLALIGLAMFVPGVLLLGTYGVMKDDSGFLQTSARAVYSDGYALVSPDVDLNIAPNDWEWMPTGGKLAVRIVATGSAAKEVFVGIGPADRVADYLDGVAHDEITQYGWGSSDLEYSRLDGGAPATPPGEQTFWVASSQGAGEQDLRWDIVDGSWTAVIMNADGSAPVTAQMSLGARFGILLTIGIVVTVVGFIFLAAGIVLIVLGAKRPHRDPAAQPPAGWGPQPPGWNPQPPGWGPQPPGWNPQPGPSGWQPAPGQPGGPGAPGAPWPPASEPAPSSDEPAPDEPRPGEQGGSETPS